MFQKLQIKTILFNILIYKSINYEALKIDFRGYSSVGRALEWHSRGQRFDPAYLHVIKFREI